MARPQTQWVKNPGAVLDYKFDWKASTNGTGDTDWLASGETISEHEIDEDTGITVDSSELSDDDTSVTVWLSGGTDKTTYAVRCEIVTSVGRTDERTMYILVEQR